MTTSRTSHYHNPVYINSQVFCILFQISQRAPCIFNSSGCFCFFSHPILNIAHQETIFEVGIEAPLLLLLSTNPTAAVYVDDGRCQLGSFIGNIQIELLLKTGSASIHHIQLFCVIIRDGNRLKFLGSISSLLRMGNNGNHQCNSKKCFFHFIYFKSFATKTLRQKEALRF